MDIRPPKKRVKPTPLPVLPVAQQLPVQPGAVDESKKRRFGRWFWILIISISAVLVILVGFLGWAYLQTQPVSNTGHERQIIIESGQTPDSIAGELKAEGVIKSALVFQWFAKFKGVENQMQAGAYALAPTQSMSEILKIINEGRVNTLRVTIVPGRTLEQLSDDLERDYGFDRAAIETALEADYDHPLLTSKPATASLEGYIYPETYDIAANATPEDLFMRTFDEFKAQIDAQKLEAKLKQRDFSLHQALTLASIIQMEVSNPKDQAQVAQVFLKRLAKDIRLQSDPTFIYPARQAGEEPRVNYPSPYNTYLHAGLPPGPIATFNLSALVAITTPAKGSYLYFVADENGVTHFAKTLEEHEANVAQFCTKHCNDF